ncbi:Uncharacterized conserved protein, DUF58 family, contains vWF domain [Geodermatophilus telluris]|uniref:Uncharacterized conserved protein, DUF58 family, contains vWF domain n=1 Tax=Geodermatophilus telluris TaxID=1190417 RepID=A0A1G6S883_9ACTN|nr:DUF58 domain-containing protein [Geodermatophilus telluris]SDD12327.1 Uncharacterized conserved protein, DUF58 family, contains vWF domain [Geodermatophilus telluris]
MTGSLRTALTSLTLRGRCLVAAGLTLLALAALLGERALAQLAVFVLALPLLSAAAVSRQRVRVGARRTVTPARVPRGEDAEVLLEVTNAQRRAGRLWLLTEQLPAELGRAPRFVVERLAGGATTALRYRVHGGRRGRYRIGPLRLRLVDPFGLVQRTTSGTGDAPLLVVPRVRELGPGGPAGGQGGGAEGVRRSIAVHGEDDVSTRAYRHGDDLRKVHWRATARTGELQVRMEERPWRASAALLLDTRVRAHLLARTATPGAAAAAAVPGPPGDPAPPPDSLEWLVEAAASIGCQLARRGAALRVVTEGGELAPAAGRGGLGPADLLDRLAGLTPTRGASLAPAVDLLSRVAGDGPVVALLGAVGPDDLAELVAARSGPARDVAVLLDVTGWADPAGSRSRRALSASSRAHLADQLEQSAALLRGAGWQVVRAGADRGVESVWAELGHARGVAVGVPA